MICLSIMFQLRFFYEFFNIDEEQKEIRISNHKNLMQKNEFKRKEMKIQKNVLLLFSNFFFNIKE